MVKQKFSKDHSRNKGHSFERDVAILFRRWFPTAKRGLQYQEGEHCPDVITPVYYVECKKYAKTLPSSRWKLYCHAVEKCELWSGSNPDMQVLLIYRLDRKEIIVYFLDSEHKKVMMTWQDFSDYLDTKFPLAVAIQESVGEKIV